MIDRKSRYRKVGTLTQMRADGEVAELVALRTIPEAGGRFRVTPGEGERLDHLGARFYRDPTQFWRIADVADVLDPHDLIVAGEAIVIPPER